MPREKKSPAEDRAEKLEKRLVEIEAKVKQLTRNPLSSTGQVILGGVERFNARKAAGKAKGVAKVSRGIRQRAETRKQNPSATGRKRK